VELSDVELSAVDPSVVPPEVVPPEVVPPELESPVVESPDVVGPLEVVLSGGVATDVLSPEVVVVSADDGVGATEAVGSPLGDGDAATVADGVDAEGALEAVGDPVVGAVDVCVGVGAMLGSTTVNIRSSNSSSLASISSGSSVPNLIRAS